ncbi:MAG: restriction endonuclease subunit S [Candidatus Sericytochromatia bacterium]
MEGLEISEIKKSELENFMDFSPEFYKKDYLIKAKKLKSFNYNDISNFSYVTDGEHGSPDWDENTNIKYVTAEYIKPNYILDGDFKTISQSQHKKNNRSSLREKDVLIYSVGAYAGYSAMAEIHLFPANIPRSVAIIRPNKNSDIISEYLTVFLNSKFGNFQSKRYSAGNAQPVLALEKINQFIVPVLNNIFQLKISEIYNKSYKKRLDSKLTYKQAEELLLETIGLKNFKPTNEKINIKSFKDSFIEEGRLDSEYYLPKYEHIKKVIENNSYGYTLVSYEYDLVKSSSKRDKSKYSYVEIGDIDISDGFASTNVIDTKDLPANAKLEVMKGDLLISKVRPNRGAVSIIDFEQDDLIVSGAFTVLREKESSNFSNEILKVLLRTNIYKEWLLKFNIGSQYPVIRDEDILNLQIPRIPIELQRLIKDKIKISQSIKKESEKLLEVAKKAVEIAIEENEEVALKFINENIKKI